MVYTFLIIILIILYSLTLTELAFLDSQDKTINIKNFKKGLLERENLYKKFSVLFLVIGVNIFTFFSTNNSLTLNIYFLVITGILLYSSIVDVLSFKISMLPIYVGILFSGFYNLYLLAIGDTAIVTMNLLAALCGFIVFYAIFFFSKGKGMGDADMYVMALMGLNLGVYGLVIAFYVMVIIGSIIGLLIAAYKRQMKGIKLPFVPFMFLGFFIAYLFGNIIMKLYLDIFLKI